MKLITALRYKKPSSVAFVGAGGKTSAIFRCARELVSGDEGNRVIKSVLVTTTTHFGSWQSQLADHSKIINSTTEIEMLEKNIPDGVVLLTGKKVGDRLSGLEAGRIDEVYKLAQKRDIPLLIEADGAHMSPLKAPAAHEPAIPEFSELVVVVAGLTGLGKPLTEPWVHRPELFAEITGKDVGDPITADDFVKCMLSESGGLKKIPQGTRTIALLNQADSTWEREQAKSMSADLIHKYQSVVIASLGHVKRGNVNKNDQLCLSENGIFDVVEQIGGIILAAGGSSRFGKPKQLLVWKGETLVRRVARIALEAGLSAVVVVTGSSAGKVAASIPDWQLRIVNNSNWSEGLSTSIRIGIQSLPASVGGVVFLQVDQPQITVQLIRKLIETHQTSLSSIVAPQINGKRANPVLFDSRTFPDLLALTGDIGGRDLFDKHPVEWVIWDDPNMLLDIDTPEDYIKIQEL